MIQRNTSFSAHIVTMARFFRSKGFSIGATEETDLLEIIDSMDGLQSSDKFREVSKAFLVKSRKQLLSFDQLYDQFWKEYHRAVEGKDMDIEDERSTTQINEGNPEASLDALKDWLYGGETKGEKEVALYSPAELLTKRDFSKIDPEDVEELLEIVRLLGKQIAYKLKRRREGARSGRLDLRKTLRKNLRSGGELLDLKFSKRRRNRIKMVLLCDVSKSMELYSRFLLHFSYAFQNAFKHVDTFVFGTALKRMTQILNNDNLDEIQAELSTQVFGWGSGTDIGGCLDEFLSDYSKSALDSNTVVIILSDGWDTGSSEQLEQALQSISRKASKIIWLNPLMGNPDFRPEVRALQIASKYVHRFFPVHNAASLKLILSELRLSRTLS